LVICIAKYTAKNGKKLGEITNEEKGAANNLSFSACRNSFVDGSRMWKRQ
jgi:hypothetical protein